MSEKGSDALMTDEERALIDARRLADEAAVKAEERKTAAQPATGDDPGR